MPGGVEDPLSTQYRTTRPPFNNLIEAFDKTVTLDHLRSCLIHCLTLTVMLPKSFMSIFLSSGVEGAFVFLQDINQLWDRSWSIVGRRRGSYRRHDWMRSIAFIGEGRKRWTIWVTRREWTWEVLYLSRVFNTFWKSLHFEEFVEMGENYKPFQEGG